MENLLEVKFTDAENFLKIKETLTRIGICSKLTNTLWQSCHILHKRQKYFITHFKEMFILDNKFSSLTEEDIQRRNAIALLLQDWNLLSIVDKTKVEDYSMKNITIISHKDKSNWNLKSKYSIGVKSPKTL